MLGVDHYYSYYLVLQQCAIDSMGARVWKLPIFAWIAGLGLGEGEVGLTIDTTLVRHGGSGGWSPVII